MASRLPNDVFGCIRTWLADMSTIHTYGIHPGLGACVPNCQTLVVDCVLELLLVSRHMRKTRVFVFVSGGMHDKVAGHTFER
jgi:hypothetical protein